MCSMNINAIAKNAARELRKNQTEAEKTLWSYLRNRRLLNKKFNRQYIIYYKINNIKKFFIVDFYCNEAKLVIEIDGGVHLKQKTYDKNRSGILKELGLHVIRFTNEEIKNNLEMVLLRIRDKLEYK